ncbi:hypothetical protein [Desulfoplanes formicivorans]|uniref:Uncharacterized protein n=1 Tax=Desulfoplanes formicivorans TaxID=1592317 RepID=A0A194AG97_9BACT|nr:hypothetical protein [Desulfoplanes formicivorans]GAU08230.1 hypothetical protein DPF_0933 [Desulfoplanes formicivorans]
MDADTKTYQEQSFFKGLWNNLLTGWKVIFSECKWLFIKAFRRWEIKQLHKRLNEEYRTLGKVYATSVEENKTLTPEDVEADIPLKQISFLKEEIEHMNQELDNSRNEYVKRRSQS